MSFLKYLCLALFLGAGVNAAPSAPMVRLNYGAFQGNTTGNVTEFLGIPFAAPPVGNLRFAPPRPPIPFNGVRQATSFGTACFQQSLSNLLTLGPIGAAVFNASQISAPISEDCLFINVLKPANLPVGKQVPVLFWIYGGGFEQGDTSVNPGNTVVARSIALNEPVIYVSANYRLNAFGFLGGKEVKAAGLGNVGLRDQRFAMQWVQEHISSFGGDPEKVTIWGESAGAISAGLHLVLNNGNPEGLFRGAFMESGSPRTYKDITAQQPYFDQLVTNTGCSGSPDPIDCLRAVPFDNLSTAINLTPNTFAFQSIRFDQPWGPAVDGIIIERNPLESLQKGLYARVPFVTGDCDDEGTLFSLSTQNITNNAEFLDYMTSNYMIPTNRLAALSQAYPDNITEGSPFDTGTADALTPEFKRLAAFQGDLIFQAPRRALLQIASKTQKTFAFLYKRGKLQVPFLGTFHASDISEFYGNGPTPDFIGTDALVNFANTGDPNLPKNPISLLSVVEWPEWKVSANPALLTFLDPAPTVNITFDNYRLEAINFLNEIMLEI